MKIQILAKSSLAYLLSLALSAIIANPASAVLIVDFQTGRTITAGGNAQNGRQQTIDVYLSSNSGDQDLNSYDLSFLIAPLDAVDPSRMSFQDGMDESWVIDMDADYVFFGNTAKDGSPGGIYEVQDNGRNPVPNDNTFAVGVDVTVDMNRRNEVIGSDPSLLARLTVEHHLEGLTPAEVAGDTFEITLRRVYLDEPIAFTRYDANLDEDVPVEFAFGERGIISVAIPEPSTFAFTSLMALGLLPMRHRRR